VVSETHLVSKDEGATGTPITPHKLGAILLIRPSTRELGDAANGGGRARVLKAHRLS